MDDPMLEAMRRAAAALDDGHQALSRAVELRALERPLPLDRISNLPWASGFGQCGVDLPALAAWRNRPVGHYTAWSDHTQFARTLDELRGGPINQLDVLGPLLTKQGSYNLIKGIELLRPEVPITWVFPMLPTGIANTLLQGAWQKPSVWDEMTGVSRPEWTSLWYELGFRVALLLKKLGKAYHLVTKAVGWECSGGWYPWSIGPNLRGWKEAWRMARDAHRQGAMAFDPAAEAIRWELRVAGSNACAGLYGLTDVWPGSEYTNVLGRSCHEDPGRAWGTDAGWAKECRDGHGFGLLDVLELAVAKGCKLAIDEWAVQYRALATRPVSADPVGAVTRMFGFLSTHAEHIACECYLHTGNTRLLDNAPWGASEAYRQLWGRPVA